MPILVNHVAHKKVSERNMREKNEEFVLHRYPKIGIIWLFQSFGKSNGHNVMGGNEKRMRFSQGRLIN
ncbi:hypothetical protein EEL34_08170 [Muribaculaceae bacterium Isolate-039 (Harlan)]|nr:hypothetical protein EEL34_08170 [Muribaculaceae bacterium Isolate-039 (Harlan)]